MSEPKKYDKDGRELLPVYACAYDEIEGEPIGYAADKSKAARLIRKHIAETQGDPDSGITAELVKYSSTHSAFCIDD